MNQTELTSSTGIISIYDYRSLYKGTKAQRLIAFQSIRDRYQAEFTQYSEYFVQATQQRDELIREFIQNNHK